MSRLYYQGAQAGVLCYDITDENSFVDMTRWLDELKKYMRDTKAKSRASSAAAGAASDDDQHPPIVLHIVGTKADVVAEDPGKRQVPFEQTIAYVAESLYPSSSQSMGGTTTGAATAAVGSRNASQSFQFPNLMNRQRQQNQPLSSPPLPSNRQPRISSLTKQSRSASDPVNFSPNILADDKAADYGFWAQDVVWDCCNEVSSKNGEGIDEVFRVITRKLVEQKTKADVASNTSLRAGPSEGIAGDLGKHGGLNGGHLPRPMTSPAMSQAQSLLRSGFSNRNFSSNYGSIGSGNSRTRRLSDVLSSTFGSGGNGSDVDNRTLIRNGHRPHLSDVATHSMDQLMSLGRSGLNLRTSRTENFSNRKRRSWLGIVRGYDDDEETGDLEADERAPLAQTVDVTGEEAREDEGRGCCFC